MRAKKESSSQQDWLKIARKDWTRIGYMLEKADADAAGFYLQQSIEKYLKAFLLQHRWKLRKIHELDALLDDAVKCNPDLERFRDLCERVSGYYMTDRYPPFGASELTSEEIKSDLREAKQFIQMLFPDEKLNGSNSHFI